MFKIWWYCGLLGVLVVLQCYISMYSHHQGLAFFQYIYWVMAPIVSFLWVLSMNKNNGWCVVALLVAILVVVRTLFFREFFVANTPSSSLIESVLITEPGSPRNGFVVGWFPMELRVDDQNIPPPGSYHSELGYLPSYCDKTILETPITTSYAVRYKRLVQRKMMSGDGGDDGWLLVLENDAYPFRLETFASSIERIATLSKYDVIWLDYRDVVSDYIHLVSYFGTVGMLLNKKSFEKINASIQFTEAYCNAFPVVGIDLFLNLGCRTKKLSCVAIPLLHERPFPSSLDWNDVLHDSRSGTTNFQDLSTFFVTFCGWFFVGWLLKKREFIYQYGSQKRNTSWECGMA